VEIEKDTCRQAILGYTQAHRNIQPFLGVAPFDPKGVGLQLRFGRHSLVSTWMKNGNLTEYMKSVDSQACKSMIVGIAEGLRYLHSRGILHGNLHTDHILVDDEGHPRIAGSGCFLLWGAEEAQDRYWAWGPPALTAPELYIFYLNDDHESRLRRGSDTPCSNVYTFAMVIIQMVTRKKWPYGNISPDAVRYEIPQWRTRPQNKELDDSLWDLIQACWADDPDDRPDMDEVVSRLLRMS